MAGGNPEIAFYDSETDIWSGWETISGQSLGFSNLMYGHIDFVGLGQPFEVFHALSETRTQNGVAASGWDVNPNNQNVRSIRVITPGERPVSKLAIRAIFVGRALNRGVIRLVRIPVSSSA